jgi:hexulose-6-phosphate isomerase
VKPTRREFVWAASLAAAGAHASGQQQSASAPASASGKRFRKAIIDSLLPESLPLNDRFQLAVDLGFEGLEAVAPDDDAMVDAIAAAAQRTGLVIHSVMNLGGWASPLTSEKPETAEKGFESLCRSLRVAAIWKADNVLLVPAVVTPAVRYQDAWNRSQEMIRRALPLARELGVCITIENVGNRFLLSPLEFARYIDEFADPHVQAYFDVGNCVILWGYPQDWLRTLGKRVRKIHLKDCAFGQKKFVPLGDGDVDWAAVVQAMTEIGYQGFVTAEVGLKRGDRDALADLARRMDAVMS